MDTDNRETEPVVEAPEVTHETDPVSQIAALLEPAQDTEEATEEAVEPQAETEPESATAEEPELVEVEGVDGKKHRIPAELKDAFLRQADYTRKTQELAELRKQVEPLYESGKQYAQLAQAVGPLIGQYQMLASRLQQYNTPETMQRWAQLQQTDPLTYFAERDEQRQAEQALVAVQGQLHAAAQHMQQAEATRLSNLTQEGAKVLASRIPDWNADKAKALTQYATKEYGFTPQELSTVVDPRMVMVLHKAHLYDQLQAKPPQVANKVQKAPPKVVKSNPAPEQPASKLNQAAYQRLRRGGGVDDAAAAIASLL